MRTPAGADESPSRTPLRISDSGVPVALANPPHASVCVAASRAKASESRRSSSQPLRHRAMSEKGSLEISPARAERTEANESPPTHRVLE